MSKICENCGKGTMMGNKVARARQELLYRSPKAFKPNLHSAKVKQADGSAIKMLLCTKCQRMVKKYAATQLTVASASKKSLITK